MALNFADRLVSNNPSAYGIVRAIEVSGHKTVSSLSALYKIPDCILSDTGDNSGNDSLGQLWYVIDAKEVYQLVNWEKRNEAGGWKPYLSGVITDEALEEILNTKQDKLIAGEGISISEDNVISCTIDTSLFRMVDELPSLEEAETNKIYLLRKENNIGELQSYTEYIVTIKVDEEGKEIKEWEKIGEYDLSIELAPYLKIEDAEKTYVKKENIVDSFEGGDPKEQVLSAEKGKELKELVDSLEERKVDSVTATEGKGIIVEGTHNDPTIGVLRDPESEGFFTIEETGLKLSGVQYAIDEAVGELTDRVELESDVVYNINEIFPGEGKGENGDQWHIQYAAAKLDAFLPAEKKVPGIKVKFINLDGNWRTFTFNGGYFLDGRNWSYDITSNDFTELATENLPTATPESNGVMSKEDKAKLDGISETINKDVDDKIAEVKETIDNYTVNGYKISTNPSLDRNDIGLGNVTNDAQIKRSEMGVPKGVATLGEDGKVPESQLPDSVLGNVKYQGVWDAVNNVPKLELNDFDSNGHYYIAINKGSQFGYDFDPGDWVINSNGRWVKIDNVDSVKSVNGQIGIVELGIEDIPNLKETLDSKATNDDFNRHLTDYKNPHKVTKDQVGLGNVDNTADLDKPISNATQALIDQTRTVLENKISELQTNTEADLEVFRSEFENKLAELAAKEEADIVAVNNSLKEAKTELQNNIDNLASKTENDLTVAKKELDNKISELSTKTESDLSTLRADLESSISVTKTELEKSISELASKTENDLNTAKSELEKAISDLTAKEEADIVAVNNALSEAKRELENSISSLASKTENDLSLATKDLNNKISELATKTESDLSTLRADLESSISVTKTDLESKITELATKTDAKFQATDSKIEATKTELQTNIDNLSHRHDDDMKDIRREIEEATAGSNEALNTHIQDKSNPHQVTKEQVGLGNVTDDAQVKRSEMGMPEGVATLDATGKVPSSQLPSFVDDVIEVDSFDLLPETGETGKIYVTKDTNLTYRWSGSQYVEISESLALGETSSTAYPGDKGKATTDKVNAHTSDYNNPHKVDKAQVGLGNVDNTADLDKPVSNATQELVDNTKKELEEKINNSGNDLQDNIDKIDERVTNIEDSIAQPGGLATLDDAGKVPLEQLPSLVDDVIEVDSFEHLPEAGEVGKIYVTKDTNLLYRWTGVKYVEVSESLHLGETADTAYAGDKGKETTDKVNSHISDFNNPHKVTAEQVGLGNVDNTSDINKPVSTAQQEALDAVKTELEEKINNSGSDLQGNIDKIDERVTNIENSVGAPDGIATLDSEGKLEVSQIPNEALNVIEGKYMTETQFTDSEGVEFIPRHNTIYIDSIGGSNKLYRWDGFKYVEVSDSDNVTEAIDNHIKDFNNPHKVTAEQIGLGNVDNTADIDKPISTAVQEALDTVNTKVTEHTENKENPHGVTAEQIGLGNVDNTADYDKPVSKATQDEIDRIDGRIDTIDNSIGVPSGIATLDGNGKLTDSQIPDKTINVLVGKLMSETEFKDEEGNTYEPRTGVIYIDTVSGTEKIYRWNKYEYVEISNTELLEGALNSHVQDKNNPHQVTKEQIGLSEVTNDAQVKRSEMGTPEGVATLNENGKIPVEQLPGQVDEVFGIDHFVSTKTDIPSSRLVIGSTYYVEDEKKIYTAISETELDEGATPDKGVIYSNRETNIIYRWDGAELVEIGNPVHLGEVAGTAYPGDKGKATTDKVNAHVADFENPHQVTKEQIGLGNVDNTSDADKPISSAVQEALDAVNKEVSEHKADKNNPHEVTKAQVGLGNVDNTADLDKPVSNATQELVDNTKKELDTKIDNHTSDFNNPHKVTKEQVGLGNVDNTADINKPVSVAQQALVDSTKAELKKDIGDIEKDVTNHIADKNNPHEVNKLQVGLGNVDNTSDINKPVSTAQQAALDKLKSDLESIIGSTGTDLSAHLKDFDNPHKVTKDQVGLGKVDNTADLEKPVSVATQEAINAVQSNLDKTNISLENHIADKKNPHEVTKEQVGLGNVDNTSDLDKPVSHYQQDALDELERRLQGSIDGSGSDLSAHISDFNNPHKVTKDQVGLGNVDNTADKDKPISDATQKALDSIKTETNTIIETHIADKNNPHEVTKEQIGLGEVTNDAQVKRSEMGVAGGVATLDQEGKVPSSQLPSFVDDVIEVDSYDNLPTTGEAGKIYVTKDTNLTYRWSGSRYIEISASLALGETSSTAYPGDKGKETTDKVNTHVADLNNPHQVTKEQVGLGNVDNTSDLDKPVSNATQELVDNTKKELEDLITSNEGGLDNHIKDFNNPHQVTAEQVGLGNVDNTADLDKPISNATQEALDKITSDLGDVNDKLGKPDGIATLDSEGKVPVDQLPSMVDDVIEADSIDHLPATGETGKIYITKDTNLIYRWNGVKYVEVSESLHLGEIEGTAYEGSKGKEVADKVNTHVSDFNNPHKVTKEQVGLGNVDNTADLDKPISNATQEALDKITSDLGSVENKLGQPGGIATLDPEGKVPSSQLPSFVDDVIEVESFDQLPATGETGKIYVTKDTNLTYRWSGSRYIEISASLALGETSSTAYAGDKGKATTDKVNAHTVDYNNPHKVTKEQVGLGNVDNTADLDKPISNATQTEIDRIDSEIEDINNKFGAEGGFATLDKDGKIPVDQLPSMVDDVIDVDSIEHLPTTGESGKIYITKDTNLIYRWNGVKYVEVSESLHLGEIEGTAYEGSKGKATTDKLESHVADLNNPHQVTKDQVGLGNVDNTSDLDKPISNAVQGALDEVKESINSGNTTITDNLTKHIEDFNNPHKVTKEQVGLGNVDNTSDLDKPISNATQEALDKITESITNTEDKLGKPGGIATLDPDGKVPSSQLPSYVDDVIEVATLDELPATGEAGKIYVTKDTNLTYRWSGSKYVEISASLALGETSSTAYAGDKGKATTDSLNAHLADFNNPHKVDKAQVGLGNVDNTSDKDKPVSDATQQLINEVKESINSGNTTITDNLTKHIEDYNNPHKVTKDQVGLGNVDNTSDKDKPLSDAAKEAINEVKTLITSSGTDLSNHIKDYTNPHRVTAEQVGLGNVNNTSDLDKPISNATQKEFDKLDAKIDKINTDQGTDLSAHLRDFSNPHKVTKEQIGLGNVDNTADLDKPISTATQKAIDDAKAANNTALDNHANRTDNPHKVTKDQVGLGNVDNTADINKPVSVAQQNALDTLSNSLNTAINNHVGNTNNPHQVTKEQVGLGKVDNTSDLEKPISVATQNAISEVVSNLDKHIADKNNPHEVTKEQIGLGRVDNTSDLEKPISTATQVALDKKAELGPDGKIPESQLPERTMHSLFYKGTWDAERNLPTLANGDKAQDGDYYLVNNDGESFGYKFMVNDIIFNASGIWYRMMGSNKRDNPTEFKITKFTADRTLLERGESTEITLEWEYQLTPSGQINFQFIDTHDIPVEERTYKITATGGQTFTLRGSYLSEVATATLTIDTADKVYVGASSNSAPTDSDFIAMNSFFSFGDNEFPFTPIDCSGGKYIYVAIPTEEYSKYRIYCNNYPVDDVTVYSRRITNIFTGYTDYTITKLANLYHGILNIEVKLIDKR